MMAGRSNLFTTLCAIGSILFLFLLIGYSGPARKIANDFNSAVNANEINSEDESSESNEVISEEKSEEVESDEVKTIEIDDDDKFLPMETRSKTDFDARAKLIGDTCENIWKNWGKTGEKPLASVPPKEIPDDLWPQYTLFGKIPVKKMYFNEMAKPQKRIWKDIDDQMSMTKQQIFGRSTYGGSTKILYEAMTEYKKFIEGKNGAVVGSQRPWAEIFSLKHGAKSVLTIEYQELDVQTTYPIKSIQPFALAANWTEFAEKLDFVVSYSSIEHSGLGRYGDPLDPFGDLREMGKMRCLLKDNGIMFLGFPVGKDALVWNAHRIYGPIRLPWMFLGFRVLGVFWNSAGKVELTKGFPVEKINAMGYFEFTQPAIVLQKIRL